MKLVYCQKCGAKNPDDAKVCVSCGQRLYPPLDKAIEAEVKTCFGKRRTPEEKECFGVPGGSIIFGILVGAIIIIAGILSLLSNLFRWDINFWSAIWPAIVIVIGILIFIGAIYGISKRKQASLVSA